MDTRTKKYLVNRTFEWLLISFLVFVVAELLKPGIIMSKINLVWYFLLLIVFGMGTYIFPEESVKKERYTLPYLLTILGICIGVAVFFFTAGQLLFFRIALPIGIISIIYLVETQLFDK